MLQTVSVVAHMYVLLESETCACGNEAYEWLDVALVGRLQIFVVLEPILFANDYRRIAGLKGNEQVLN